MNCAYFAYIILGTFKLYTWTWRWSPWPKHVVHEKSLHLGTVATSNEQIVASTVVYIHISNLSKRNGMENIKFNIKFNTLKLPEEIEKTRKSW